MKIKMTDSDFHTQDSLREYRGTAIGQPKVRHEGVLGARIGCKDGNCEVPKGQGRDGEIKMK